MEVPSQEDISSIYDDLVGQGDLGLIIHNLQVRNKQLQDHVTTLEEDIQKLCNNITEMKQTQENLSRNISELYKTAKNEIERKDRLIADLQSRLDDMIFKRNTAPSNFGIKRQREEVTHHEEMNKRLRSDVKSEQNREQHKGTSLHESELSKSSYSNDKKGEIHEKKRSEGYDKKQSEINQMHSEYEVNRNHRNNDTHDNMKHQNFVRNEERKLDTRDHSRYGHDSKRSSNFRNYRRDNERSFRRYNDRDRRSSRERDYRADRFDDYREARNKNFRNEKFNREQHRRSDDREHIGTRREIKNEPRFSSIEPTRSTPDFVVEADDCLNLSREEGEIVDNDSDIKPIFSDKSNYDTEIDVHKESMVLCENKIYPPNDKIHPYNSRSIEKYNSVCTKKESEGKNIEKHSKVEKLHIKNQYSDKNVINDMKGIVEEKNDNTQIMENLTSKESLEFVQRSSKSVEESDVKIISSANKNSLENKIANEGEVNMEKITIISQVVLNESKTDNIGSQVGAEVISKEVIKPKLLNKIGCSTENKIVKFDKPIRECRVPRNLTGELDINIDKARLVRDNIKELHTEKQERIKKNISSVFDTPIKNIEQNLDKSVNFESSFDITHNGGKTQLEKSDVKESVQTNIEITASTPVSEFQIFRTNFHTLERSNNITFQKDLSNIPMNSFEMSTQKISDGKESNTKPQKSVQDGLNQNISEGGLQNFISEDLVNTSQTVKNEKIVCGNTNDISNISLDLLNTNLAMCKAEDFPNLTSCTESKDMPNLLLTTVSKSTSKHENSSVISSKSLDIENISKTPSTNTAVEENSILKGNTNDAKSLVPTNTAVNNSVSPNIGNIRKKRKRCVIGWAK